MRKRHETRARDVCKRCLLNVFIDPDIQPHNLHTTTPLPTLRSTFGEKPRANWGLSLRHSVSRLSFIYGAFFGNNTMGIYHMTAESEQDPVCCMHAGHLHGAESGLRCILTEVNKPNSFLSFCTCAVQTGEDRGPRPAKLRTLPS